MQTSATVRGGGRDKPPRMSSAFVPALSTLDRCRVFSRGGALVHSIAIKNRSAQVMYACAFDSAKPGPKEGETLASRSGDRHTIEIAAGTTEAMIFPYGWEIQRGLYVIGSTAETVLTLVPGIADVENNFPGPTTPPSSLALYWNVEYDLVRASDDTREKDNNPTDEDL